MPTFSRLVWASTTTSPHAKSVVGLNRNYQLREKFAQTEEPEKAIAHVTSMSELSKVSLILRRMGGVIGRLIFFVFVPFRSCALLIPSLYSY